MASAALNNMQTVIFLLGFVGAGMFLLYVKGISQEQLSPAVRTIKSISKYIVATFVATFGAAGVAALICSPLLMYSRWMHSPLAENIFSALLDRPYFPLQVAIAFVLGLMTARLFSGGWPMLVWVLPLIEAVLVITAVSHRRGVLLGFWGWVRSALFNWACGCSATLLQWEIMLPLYASVAFSIGVLIRYTVAAKETRSHNRAARLA